MSRQIGRQIDMLTDNKKNKQSDSYVDENQIRK